MLTKIIQPIVNFSALQQDDYVFLVTVVKQDFYMRIYLEIHRHVQQMFCGAAVAEIRRSVATSVAVIRRAVL